MSGWASTFLLYAVCFWYVVLIGACWWSYRENDKRCRARHELLEIARRQQLDAQFTERMRSIELRRHVFNLGRGQSKNAWLN